MNPKKHTQNLDTQTDEIKTYHLARHCAFQLKEQYTDDDINKMEAVLLSLTHGQLLEVENEYLILKLERSEKELADMYESLERGHF